MYSQSPHIQALTLGRTMALAKLWKIERLDGTTLYFTDHNVPIEYAGNTYLPGTADVDDHDATGAPVGSALERSGGFNEATIDLQGPLTTLSSNAITADDIRAGKYDSAKVTEYIVDWRFPWASSYVSDVYWITGVSWDRNTFRAELSTLITLLRHRRGREYTRACPYRLGENDGDTGCFYTIPAELFSVTAVDTQRLVVTGNYLSTTPATGWSEYGVVRWSTGDNAGIVSEVKIDALISGASHQLTFQEPTPYDIAVSDTGLIEPGCNKTTDHCDTKFSRFPQDYGGFPDMPGDAALSNTPDSK